MAYDIGPKIGIQGEAEFNRQIKNINNSLRECGSEMKLLSSQFEDNANSQEALIAKNKTLQKELDLQKQKMGLLEGQYEKQVKKLKSLADAYQRAKEDSGEMSDEAMKAEKAFNRQAESVSKLQVSMNETKTYINQLNNTMDKNDTMLKQIEDGARDAATGYSELDNASKSTADGLEEVNKKLDSGNMMEAADTISGLGDKVLEFGQKSMDAFSDLESTITRVNTFFGLTGDEAEQMGTVIEDIFRTGVTDSLEEVGNAVITVNQNLKDLDPSQLETITGQAITMEQVFGADMNETMRGVNALMVNFGLDAQTAMDYIVTGSQNGLDKTQELGDNLSEYSGKFSQAGYSAEEYFQLLQNGLEGGAYNLDKVNDSINEVTTRLSDGTIGESLAIFSEETQNTFKAWQEGGASQKDVINSIVKDITNCTNQQEQLTMASTAFGTMGEDANMQVVTSLTTLGDEYNDVSGAAQKMSDDSTTPMKELQGAINDMTTALAPVGEKLVNLATEILPPVIEFITNLIDGFLNLPAPVKAFIGVLAGLLALFSALTPVITAVISIISVAGSTVLLPVIGIIAGIAAAVAAIIAIIQNWGAITEWFGGVWETICNTVQSVWETVSSAVMGAIQGFVDWIKNAWETIKTAISTAMETIKTTISNVWQAILDNPIVQSIVAFVTSAFENLKNTLSGIWEGIKSIAQGAWELIKNIVLAPVLLLIDLVTGNFDKLKSDISNIWNNIKDAASNIWNGIKQVVSSYVDGLKNFVVNIFTNLKDAVSGIWDAIKSTASNVWNAIKDSVSNIAENLKNAAVNAFHNLVAGIGDSLSSLGSVVKNGFQSAIDFITSLPSRALQWGKDFINGIANGIKNAIGAVTDAVSGVADKIRSFLHFSRPDEGPLREYEKWMPDFMTGLANGIYSNINKIQKAAKDVSSTIDTTITGTIPDIVSNTPTIGTGMIVVDGDTIVLDGKAIGKSATKYITTGQRRGSASKGRRLSV